MSILIELSDERKELVRKEELQFLLDVHQIVRFKRTDGWVVVGQDKMRKERAQYSGKECRTCDDFSTAQDEVFSLDA